MLKNTIKWNREFELEGIMMESAIVAGVSCAHSIGHGEETWSFNTGSGRTHYFKTEAKFLAALTTHLA